MKLGLPIGLSVIFWSLVGLIRVVDEKVATRHLKKPETYPKKKADNVAALVPAHNESVAILKTIKALKRNLPPKQIYVVSDNSIDNTAKIVRSQRCNVLELKKPHGKSRALVAGMKKFNLLKKYEFLIIVDADTMLSPTYVKKAIRQFSEEKEMVALAAYALPYWRNYKRITKRDFISAYRTRLYRVLQWIIMYGQTWKHANVNPVIPGFAAMYRTSTLKKLKFSIPGIWIEDFSMAFQIHKQKLGKIGHYPEVYAVYQDPQTVTDYFRQVRRWNVGFYQTVKFFGIWPSFFWLSLAIFTFEILAFSLLTLFLPILAFVLTTQFYAPIINPSIVSVSQFVSEYYLELWELFLVFFILDYLLTVFVAFKDKKYMLLFYGLFFIFFQYLNTIILWASLPKGLFSSSGGTWTPVKRR
jgi:cellulose synthase/poly-beta-1,6-N-acetylglucosamine synthase-like glycosyltransferase